MVTESRTVPAGRAGETATIWVDDLTVKDWAVVVPNLALVAVENPDPVTITWVPPATGPFVRERDVMVGTAA